eukprot:3236386-Rhodomonas_salina.1
MRFLAAEFAVYRRTPRQYRTPRRARVGHYRTRSVPPWATLPSESHKAPASACRTHVRRGDRTWQARREREQRAGE